jgi:hypothetical protein
MAVFRSGRSSGLNSSDWNPSPFSRDRYSFVSNRISTERAPASSEFCRSSRNTVFNQGNVPEELFRNLSRRTGLTCEFSRITCYNFVDESSLIHLYCLIMARCPLSRLGRISARVLNTFIDGIHKPMLPLSGPLFEKGLYLA